MSRRTLPLLDWKRSALDWLVPLNTAHATTAMTTIAPTLAKNAFTARLPDSTSR